MTARLVDPGWSAPPTTAGDRPRHQPRAVGSPDWRGEGARAPGCPRRPPAPHHHLARAGGAAHRRGERARPVLGRGHVGCLCRGSGLPRGAARVRAWRRTRRNRPFPVLDRVPQPLLVVLGVAAGLGVLFLGSAAWSAPSAVEYARAETVLARVAAVDDAGEWAMVEVPDAENLRSSRTSRFWGSTRPTSRSSNPTRESSSDVDPPDGWAASCGEESGHCVAIYTLGEVSVDADRPCLPRSPGPCGRRPRLPRRHGLAPSPWPPSSSCSPPPSLRFILRCLSLTTWRRSRQSLDAPGVQTIARSNVSAVPLDAERAGGDDEETPESLETVTVAADWYPDPRGVSRLRYWNGQEWTDHIAD